ncbi:MAG: hypothetical protein IKV07_01445 [Bacteroidaceae bacterium]|nr:hypothetical protein [Bacteroidaceae bacterium]
MTWAYLYTVGTTKHLNEHKHTHAYSAGFIVPIACSLVEFGRFTVNAIA